MKKIDLQEYKHEYKVGRACEPIQPNVKEDCLIYYKNEFLGFYMRKITGRLKQFIEIANKEFRSDNVPKTKNNRISGQRQTLKTKWDGKGHIGETPEDAVQQYSTILGAIKPNAFVGRKYPTISSVHLEDKARTFIKAMLGSVYESEQLIKKIMPEQYNNQKQLLLKTPKQYRFGNLFTSSISNFNISAPFHRDTGNIKNCVNVIITKRKNSKGGNLYVPDYNACFDQCDNSILVYPAWRNLHGVTPIEPTFEGGYRNSLIFYALNGFHLYNKNGTKTETNE